MRKRLILLILALVSAIGIVFSLCACDKSAQSPSALTEGKRAEEPTVVETEGPEIEIQAETAQPEVKTEVKTEKKPEPRKEETSLPQKEEIPQIPVSEEGKEKANTCLISVSCDTILKRPELLAEEKRELLPTDGKILDAREVTFEEGESAFDILLRVLKEEKIHIEFMETPLYDSVYIEGIGNIYEMDCGKLSGWMYKVNGNFLQVSSSEYQPKSGDEIEWVYTCDAGKDIGGQ